MIDHNGNARPTEVRTGDGVTPGRASTAAQGIYPTDSCPCNNDVFGQGPCSDCRSVFAAKREQLLASLRASEAQGWPEVPAWRLGIDPIYNDENDQPENIT